jgi:hypothetical protein
MSITLSGGAAARVSIEIWPADPKLRLVRIDPLPQLFACGESLQTGLPLDAHEIDGKSVATVGRGAVGRPTTRMPASTGSSQMIALRKRQQVRC